MVINCIHIDDFGAQHARTLSLTTGLNLAEGANESGKTTVAAFLAFLFYGITPSFAADGPTPSGFADVTCRRPCRGDTAAAEPYRYRIVRTAGIGDAANVCAVYALRGDTAADENLLADGEEPGMFFFGVTERVFSATALVTQVSAADWSGSTPGEGEVRGSSLSGDAVRAAMERILYAADEELDPQYAIRTLAKQKSELYDEATGRGSVADLEKRRNALAAAVEAQEAELRAAADEPQQEIPPAQPDAPAEVPAVSVQTEPASPPVTEEARALAGLDAPIRTYEEKKREKEAQNDRLAAMYEAYQTHLELEGTEDPAALSEREEAARKRAEGLSKSMFRGGYIPDRDYTNTLRSHAAEFEEATAEMAAAAAAEKKLAFSVSCENLKENQLRRIALDGGSTAVHEKFKKICKSRTTVTIFGIFFLFFAVLMLAASIVLLLLHNDTMKNAVLVTAILGAFSGFFFFYRNRFQKSINVMLTRYSCATEDELENFFEEFVLSEHKLQKLDENKETLSKKRSQASLRAGEAARQAAVLLSRLQPPGSARLAADRLTAEVIVKAAERIEHALDEIAKQTAIADDARRQTDAILERFGVSDIAALRQYRETLAAQFARKNADGTPVFEKERVMRELDFNIKACAAMETKLAALRKKRDTLQKLSDSAHAAAAEHGAGGVPESREVGLPLPQAAGAANCLPDSALLKSLLDEMDTGLRRARRTYAALTLAADTMQNASAQLHTEIAPRLLADAGRTMGYLTGQRFGALSLDSDMALTAAGTATEDGVTLKLDHLSAGTQELAYLSLRMALIDMLYRQELPPLIFDEAFATLDDKRLARMISMLMRKTAQQGQQALVFTCHKRERKAAEAIGGCNIIRL